MPKDKPNKLIKISYFTQEGTQKRKEGLMHHNWEATMLETDPNSIYDQIVSVYSHHYNSNISTKMINRNSKKHKKEPCVLITLV